MCPAHLSVVGSINLIICALNRDVNHFRSEKKGGLPFGKPPCLAMIYLAMYAAAFCAAIRAKDHDIGHSVAAQTVRTVHAAA